MVYFTFRRLTKIISSICFEKTIKTITGSRAYSNPLNFPSDAYKRFDTEKNLSSLVQSASFTTRAKPLARGNVDRRLSARYRRFACEFLMITREACAAIDGRLE